MGQPTKELLLEILSEEPAPSVSSPSNNTSSASAQQDVFPSSLEITPSPFKGEPVMSSVELGWGEGKEHGQINGVVVGQLKDINDQGQPLVDFSSNPSLNPVQARSTVQLDQSHLGQDMVLMFEQGDLGKPIIMGVMQKSGVSPGQEPKHGKTVQVDLDNERLTFTAKKEIVFKCGKASITLTKAGKILIRGSYLLSRSSGVNRVKGGSVQIN